jgi:flagellar basal body-associated protein FliL
VPHFGLKADERYHNTHTPVTMCHVIIIIIIIIIVVVIYSFLLFFFQTVEKNTESQLTVSICLPCKKISRTKERFNSDKKWQQSFVEKVSSNKL